MLFGKAGASGQRVLSDRQVPAVHPLAAAIQRGAQAESQSVRPAKWFQRQDKVMHRFAVRMSGLHPMF